MKDKIKDSLLGLLFFSQLFVSITYIVIVVKEFSFDNLVIFYSALGGMVVTLKYINGDNK